MESLGIPWQRWSSRGRASLPRRSSIALRLPVSAVFVVLMEAPSPLLESRRLVAQPRDPGPPVRRLRGLGGGLDVGLEVGGGQGVAFEGGQDEPAVADFLHVAGMEE